MFCPRCGKPAEMGEMICSNCGLKFDVTNQGTDVGFGQPPAPTDIQIIIERISKLNIKMIIFDLFALTVLVLSFIAANKISGSGSQIIQIRSTGGNTVNEVYYREMGSIYIGLAMFIRACGIFFFSVLVSLGLKKNK